MTASPLSSSRGKAAALVVYIIYLLSIPSLGLMALVGAMTALICREGADPIWRAHLDNQVRMFAIVFVWGIALLALSLLGWVLTVVLVGFLLLWLAGLGYFAVMLWFTVKAVLGLLALFEERPA